ncbi:MAG: hypothetical protein ACI8RZ_005941, partial [Myxococcota bacterium]
RGETRGRGESYEAGQVAAFPPILLIVLFWIA